MIKRFFVTMILALGVLSASYADVKVKDLGGGKVEITFTFKDPASEMGVIGSFNNWTEPGLPMTLNADGLWEKTIAGLATDEIVYKFFTKGSYVFDEKAPDKKDDGFGGHNGLIVVADILSGVTSGGPADTIGAAPAKAYNSKLNFGTFTIIGSKSTFSTQGVVDKTQKGLETDTTGLFAKSYWKVGGTIVPGTTLWFEIKAFEGYQPFWQQDSRGAVTTDLGTGLGNLGSGLFSNPIYYLNANKKPELNSLKTGLETPVLVWETGYGYAKPQKRTAVLWETLNERDANGGYMRFDLGPEWKKLGDATLEAAVAPNKMNGNFGFFGWFDFAFKGTKIDLQYDAKSAESDKLAKVFNKLYHQDFLVAAQTKMADLTLSAQGLVNQYSESAFDSEKNLAGEVKASWALPDEVLGLTAGYRYTGSASELLYGNNDDALGTKGTQKITGNTFGKAGSVKFGLDTDLTLDNKTPAAGQTSSFILYNKPWFEVALDPLVGSKASFNGYVRTRYGLREGYWFAATRDRLVLGEVGAKYYQADPVRGAVNGIDLYYGLNGWEKDKVLNTLIANLTLPQDTTVQLGFGLRMPRAYLDAQAVKENNLYAFTVGASWKLPEPALKSPQIYGAFVYNMDPYDDGGDKLDMADFIPDGGVGKNDGKAILRLMMKWDF